MRTFLSSGRRLDLLAVNGPGAGFFRGLPSQRNYLRWLLLEPASGTLCADWDIAVREACAMLRLDAARHPYDSAVATLVAELSTASPVFARIWAEHEVDIGAESLRRYHHPEAGEVLLHRQRLDLPEPDQMLLAYSAVAGSASDLALRRLIRAVEPDASRRLPVTPTVHPANRHPNGGARLLSEV